MKRNGATPTEMDSLQYFYYANKNQLAFIKDSVPANFYSDDLDNQSANNYQYDKIGNLFSDASEEIQQIKWTVYGKVKKIKRTGTSKKPQLDFEYDALNNRVRKVVKDSANKEVETFYVRDVQGNILATYNYVKGSGKGGNKLYLDEQVIYGSSRIGTIKRNKLLPTKNLIINPVGGLPGKGKPFPIPINPIVTKRYSSFCGSRRYELDSWNGNVQTVISDKKVPVDSNNNGWVDYYTANVISAYDYSNGVGAILPDRIFEKESYTFGAQGSEVDEEINGTRNNITTFFRLGDLRKGQWNSVDPMPDPGWGTYSLLNGNSILYNDPQGDVPILSGVVGFFKGLFADKMKFEKPGISRFRNAFRSAARHEINAWKILGGLFTADKNKSFFGKAWQITSRFTWELPQTLAGYLAATGANIFGNVKNVYYSRGATVVNMPRSGGAFTLSSYIVGVGSLFRHEYGHYLQSQRFGPLYLPVFAIPSFLSARRDIIFNTNYHPYFWTEKNADIRSYRYLNQVK